MESNIDKCKGLIAYVAYIESKVVKLNGIGTQMHIDANTDRSKVAEMFRLLAATGKLIRVSELDMGLSGKKAAQATPADYNEQKDTYKYVVQTYLQIIPKAQQYGITLWSPLDSPENSFWRGRANRFMDGRLCKEAGIRWGSGWVEGEIVGLIPEKKGTAHLKLHCALFFAHSEKGISKTNTMWYVALKHFEGFAGK